MGRRVEPARVRESLKGFSKFLGLATWFYGKTTTGRTAVADWVGKYAGLHS